MPDILFIQNPEECFPERWIASYFVPIIFDVKIWIPIDLEGGECEEFLPCLISLLFHGVKKYSYKLLRVLHKECYNGILQLRSSLCNTVQNVRQSGL